MEDALRQIRFASLIVTYRCNAKCKMCNTWMYPSSKEQEISPKLFEKLPKMHTVNITGGEPFLRDDLEEIINILRNKTKRIVISTNGYLNERILAFFDKNKDIGIRISVEGFSNSNDYLRGLKDGFDNALKLILDLKRAGIKDIGFGITLCDTNVYDLVYLYRLAEEIRVEFASAAIHNSFYFHKYDNKFEHKDRAVRELYKLIWELLRSKKIKNWFRAYFNYGLIRYIEGKERLLPCEMGFDSFFLDPYGEIYPCNVMEQSMGNIYDYSFEEIWFSERANSVRDMVKKCNRNCWMIGSTAQQIRKYFGKPIKWIIKHKLLKKPLC